MSFQILGGDVFDTLPRLAAGSVDAVVTSPPYWRLRSYLPAEHPLKALELGSEATPAEFVDNLVRVFRLVRNAMAPWATCWVNIGDSYSSGNSGEVYKNNGKGACGVKREPVDGIPAGNLCLIPQRLAIALQDDGWIVRSVVCWCLSPSTVLYAKTATTEGPMTIHDLVRLDSATVKLWTGEKWSQVQGWSETETAGNTVRFTLRSGETISCTDNHRWPLADGRILPASEIQEGDSLATCSLPQPEKPDGLALDDLAWFAGLYLAEGHINDDCIVISGHSKETERHVKVERIAKKYGGSATLHCDGDTAIQRVHGNVLLGAIAHFISGTGAKGKHFHPRTWRCSNGVLWSLLRGYLDGDGHWDEKNGRWRLGFCRNNALAQDIRTASARLDLTLTLNATYSRIGRTRRFDAYRGELRTEKPEHHNSKCRSEVVKIERGWGGTFYDIGIADEPHLFSLASGVLTHNSKPAPMPASLAGWSWRRCRVKQSNGKVSSKKTAVVTRLAEGLNDGTPAEWADCTGCKKCNNSGGYVLRRGSWRPTSSWEPVLMLAKTADYYGDGEAVKTPSAAATVSRNEYSRIIDDPDEQYAVAHDHETTTAGANLRDVWTIAAEPLKEKHYAAFPSELVYRCLAASTSSRGYCVVCGQPWCRVMEYARGIVNTGEKANGRIENGLASPHTTLSSGTPGEAKTLTWRPSCAHSAAGTRPGLVLDPFCGSGRTGVEAARLGLDFVGAELNPSYIEMATRLLREQSPLFA
jgi:DNA modification methylase